MLLQLYLQFERQDFNKCWFKYCVAFFLFWGSQHSEREKNVWMSSVKCDLAGRLWLFCQQRRAEELLGFFHRDFIPTRYFLKTRGSVSYTETQMVQCQCFGHVKCLHTDRQKGGRFQRDSFFKCDLQNYDQHVWTETPTSATMCIKKRGEVNGWWVAW